MRSKRMTIWVIVVLISFQTEATVVFEDGEEHTINYSIMDDVAVYTNFWGFPTIVNIELMAQISGQVLIADPYYTYCSSQVYIYGGRIGYWSNVSIKAHHNSRAYIAGGVMGGEIALYQTSVVTLYGSDFMIDGQPVYGTLTGIRDGWLTGKLLNPQGTITRNGTSGTPLSCNLWVDDGASLVLVEAAFSRDCPCTRNEDCYFYEWCAKTYGDCDGVGNCRVRPYMCILIVGPPVCGCDGITYDSGCAAARAGVNINYMGPCGHYLGDLNGDGDVELHDLSILASAWLAGPGDDKWNPDCDINWPADNSIDMRDFAALARDYLRDPLY